MKKTIAILCAALGLSALAQPTVPFSNIIVTGSVDLRTNGNITNAATVTAAHFVGDGSGITGVSLGTNGINGIGGKATNLTVAAPVLTNAVISASNTAFTALMITNNLGTNTYVDWLGGTNSMLARLWRAGVLVWEYGIMDNTNITFSIYDAVSGQSALSISNGNDSVVFTGNIYGQSNLTLSSSPTIYAGANQLIATHGTANFFAGVSAGNQTNTGIGENVGIGKSALGLFYNASKNVAVGYEAMQNVIAGPNNVAIGAGSLASATNLLWNVGVGTASLGALVSGTNNTALGYSSGSAFNGTESYNIDVGNTGVAGESYTIRLGTPGTHTATYFAGSLYGGPLALGGNGFGNGAVMQTLSNSFVPSDLTVDYQGQAGQVNRLRFLVGGSTNWQLAAASNSVSLLDSNGVAALSVTNLTHSVGVHGNAQFDSNVTVAGTLNANASGLTNLNFSQFPGGLLLSNLIACQVWSPFDWGIYVTTNTNYYAFRGDYQQAFVSNDFAGLMNGIINQQPNQWLTNQPHVYEFFSTSIGSSWNAFWVSNTIVVPTFVTFRGQGDQGTMFKPAAGFNGSMFVFGTPSISIPSIVRIENIRFQDDNVGDSVSAVWTTNLAELDVDNCEFFGFGGSGITLASSVGNAWSYIRNSFFVVNSQNSAFGVNILTPPANDYSELHISDTLFESLGGVSVNVTNGFRRLDINNCRFWGRGDLVAANPLTNPAIMVGYAQHGKIQNNWFYSYAMTNTQFTGLINFCPLNGLTNADFLISENFNDLSSYYITGPGIVTNLVAIGANVTGVNQVNNQFNGILTGKVPDTYNYSPITNGSAGVALAYNTYYTNTFRRKAKVYFTSANSTAASYQVEIFVFNTNQPFVAPPIYVTQPNLSIGTNTTVFELGAWDYFGMTNTIGTATIITNFCQY